MIEKNARNQDILCRDEQIWQKFSYIEHRKRLKWLQFVIEDVSIQTLQKYTDNNGNKQL